MKNSTKGAAAAGTAVILLLGGAGTLASCNYTETATGGDVTAGQLALTPVTAGAWALNGTAVADISTIKVVPGDEVTFTAAYDIVATGENLQADVTVTGADVTGPLATEMTSTVSKTIGGSGGRSDHRGRQRGDDRGGRRLRLRLPHRHQLVAERHAGSVRRGHHAHPDRCDTRRLSAVAPTDVRVPKT